MNQSPKLSSSWSPSDLTLAQEFSGTPLPPFPSNQLPDHWITEVSSPSHRPQPNLSYAEEPSQQAHTIVEVLSPQKREQIAALLQSFSEALRIYPEADRFFINQEALLLPAQPLSADRSMVITAKQGRGTMAALRKQLQEAGLGEISKRPLLQDQIYKINTKSRVTMGEDPLTRHRLEQIIALINNSLTPSLGEQKMAPTIPENSLAEQDAQEKERAISAKTREIFMLHQTRLEKIESKRTRYEEELQEPSLTSKRKEELTTLLHLLQRAVSYQSSMMEQLLSNRAQWAESISKENKTRKVPRHAYSRDNSYLKQHEMINSRANAIERRIEQLEKAFSREQLIKETRGEIEVAYRDSLIREEEGEELPLIFLQEAQDEIEESFQANQKFILLLIKDAQKTVPPFVMTPEEKEAKRARNMVILRHEGRAQAHHWLALLKRKYFYMFLSDDETGEEISQIQQALAEAMEAATGMIDETNRNPIHEEVLNYLLQLTELHNQRATLLSNLNDSQRVEKARYLSSAVFCINAVIEAARHRPPYKKTIQHFLRAAESYQQTSHALDNLNDQHREERVKILHRASQYFYQAAEEVLNAEETSTTLDEEKIQRLLFKAEALFTQAHHSNLEETH